MGQLFFVIELASKQRFVTKSLPQLHLQSLHENLHHALRDHQGSDAMIIGLVVAPQFHCQGDVCDQAISGSAKR
jgi:hypothetical protein